MAEACRCARERRERVPEALEWERPFADRQIEEQFSHPDWRIHSGLHETGYDDNVQEHVIAARCEADEFVRQVAGPVSRAADPRLPFGAGFIVADESKDGQCL